MASAEYQGCPPGVVRGSAAHPSTASALNHTVRLPRRHRLASYAGQFVTLCVCLGMWWRRSWFSLKGKAGTSGSGQGQPPTPGRLRAPPSGSVHKGPLWDKVCRADVLVEAYRRCRANRGAPGVDGETFEAIEAHGVEAWLERLRQELCARAYRPRPLLRVWIPKSDGGQRPLGIPTIRDRVVQAAMVIVLESIFEADLLPNQYGFRPRLDAKMAVRRAYWHITDSGRTEVVDADLRDYFGSIPHGPLLRCVARRVADGTVLSVIKSWLEMPVVERTPRGTRRTTEARNRHRGTPQGATCSPLLSNLYFRRFLLAWSGT